MHIVCAHMYSVCCCCIKLCDLYTFNVVFVSYDS